MPSNLSYKMEKQTRNLYNIEIMWKQPKLLPDFYKVKIIDKSSKEENSSLKSYSHNVTGVSQAFITKLHLFDFYCNAFFRKNLKQDSLMLKS